MQRLVHGARASSVARAATLVGVLCGCVPSAATRDPDLVRPRAASPAEAIAPAAATASASATIVTNDDPRSGVAPEADDDVQAVRAVVAEPARVVRGACASAASSDPATAHRRCLCDRALSSAVAGLRRHADATGIDHTAALEATAAREAAACVGALSPAAAACAVVLVERDAAELAWAFDRCDRAFPQAGGGAT